MSARLALQPHDVLDTCALDVRVSQRHLTFSSATVMQLQERTVSLGICTVRAVVPPDLRCGMSASDRQRPLVTVVNGPLMPRRSAARPVSTAAPWPPVLVQWFIPGGVRRK